MRRLLLVALLVCTCQSSLPVETTDKTARIHGFVVKVDTAQMVIHLAPPLADNTSDIPAIRYNSLTILDRAFGPSRVEQLQPGEEVTIFGRESESGDVVADRIVVIEPARTRRR